MDNAILHKAVLAELARIAAPPTVRASAADGIVTLSGSVADDKLRRRIEQRLLALREVMDVHNYLQVTPPCDGLREQLLALLKREGVAMEGLEVTIRDAVVTFSGRAANWFDRDAMSRLAWSLPGVREVVNRATLPPGAVEPDLDANGDPLA